MAVLNLSRTEHGLDLMRSIGVKGGFGLAFSALFVYYFVRSIYRLYFHPLAKYPGPKIAAVTRLWYAYHLFRGTHPRELKRLHIIYGPKLRVAPDELSYSSPQAWDDIYGFRVGKPEMGKDVQFYKKPAEESPSIISDTRENHSAVRRLMTRGFSDAALRAQEPLIKSYVDLLIQRLSDRAAKGEIVDMVAWYNFTTFDIIGDLAFGEPFGCLRDGEYHPWVKMIFPAVKTLSIFQGISYYPWIAKLVTLIPNELDEKFKNHNNLTEALVDKRIESKVDRLDLTTQLVKPENGVPLNQIYGNCSALIVAGSETTATALSATTYFLCMNPRVMKKVVEEVRSAFKSADEINFQTANRLTYLLAVLNESLRMFPPAAGSTPRRVPRGGDFIDGAFVPAGITVSVQQVAANGNPDNWHRAGDFVPERWLGDPEFKNDKRHAMQSFSLGPRNCIGKNLAYLEMRVIMARILFAFDLEHTKDGDWTDIGIWAVASKKPLMIKLTPVNRG